MDALCMLTANSKTGAITTILFILETEEACAKSDNFPQELDASAWRQDEKQSERNPVLCWRPPFLTGTVKSCAVTIGTLNGCLEDCFNVKSTRVRPYKGSTSMLHEDTSLANLKNNSQAIRQTQIIRVAATEQIPWSLLVYRLAKEGGLMKGMYHTKAWGSSLKALSLILQFQKTSFELLAPTQTWANRKQCTSNLDNFITYFLAYVNRMSTISHHWMWPPAPIWIFGACFLKAVSMLAGWGGGDGRTDGRTHLGPFVHTHFPCAVDLQLYKHNRRG